MESFYPEFKDKPYLEQWERVNRWYKKLLLVKSGYYKDLDYKELLDIVYVFFLNIHHLKDWVRVYKNKSFEKGVNSLVKKQCFVISGELANGHKHLLKDKHSTDKSSSIKHQNVKVRLSRTIFSLSKSAKIEEEAFNLTRIKYTQGAEYSWDFVYKDNKYDCYEIAKQCYEEWLVFFETNKML